MYKELKISRNHKILASTFCHMKQHKDRGGGFGLIFLISFSFKDIKELIKCYSFWKLKTRLLCRTTIQKNMFKVLKFSWNHKIWGIHVPPYETTKRQGRWIWADFFDRFLSLKWDKMHNKCKDLYLKEPLLRPSLELWKIGSRLYRQLSWRPKAHFVAFRSLYTRDTKKTCKPAENTNFSARRKMPPRERPLATTSTWPHDLAYAKKSLIKRLIKSPKKV